MTGLSGPPGDFLEVYNMRLSNPVTNGEMSFQVGAYTNGNTFGAGGIISRMRLHLQTGMVFIERVARITKGADQEPEPRGLLVLLPSGALADASPKM